MLHKLPRWIKHIPFYLQTISLGQFNLFLGMIIGFVLSFVIFLNYDCSSAFQKSSYQKKLIFNEMRNHSANSTVFQHSISSKFSTIIENNTNSMNMSTKTPKLFNSSISSEIKLEDYNKMLSFQMNCSRKNKDRNTLALKISKRIKILCLITTIKDYHKSRAIHVKNTWAKHCNKFIFISSVNDYTLPSIKFNITEGREFLWGKTKAAFQYAYDHYINKFDWFLKADDDTFVILENLRYMLMPHSSEEPIYFGCKFKPFVKQGYMSGGAGYVMSRKSLKLLVEEGFTNASACSEGSEGSEDAEIGVCLENVGVKAGDSRDALGRHRFMPFTPENHMNLKLAGEDFWIWKYMYYNIEKDQKCCSEYAISFHYIRADFM
ncbi:hypothetical protein Mgra_00001451 [Meloidogyne graminicola]|uniref:Glycoprotein-N-acetylgalactosamine 3-beta-galactosyltransferase 1 n=1 Tax=Meloidogyne graminicola TaxID=189291 RepID=A0A8T0A0U7_9BILA|nr:hypothetical protein Mgra_00001451 [Meloidogyne graminicola]